MKKIVISLLFTLILLFPTNIFACACCAEQGEYSIWTGKPSEYDLEVISGIEFDKKANLFMTEADFEIIKGLDEIKSDFSSQTWAATAGQLDLVNSFANKTWKFNLKTKSGKTGVLTLPMPMQMLKFKVDIHDGKIFGAGGPSLYKEFRFKGNVQSGTGFFRAGIVKPTTYFLVFQGRGNGCDNTEDFTNWRLEIDGKKAKYAFFGELPKGKSDESEDEETDNKSAK